MTPDQARAARELLGWTRRLLAVRSNTSMHMVETFEDTGRTALLYNRKERVDGLAAMRAALEAAGVEFTSGEVPGVRLRKLAGTE